MIIRHFDVELPIASGYEKIGKFLCKKEMLPKTFFKHRRRNDPSVIDSKKVKAERGKARILAEQIR